MAAADDLAIVGDLHLHAWQRLTDGAHFPTVFVTVTDSDDRRCLSQAVTFKHRHLDG